MFVGNAKSLRSFMCSTLGRLHPFSQTLARLERLASDKRSSLLQIFVNYGRKKTYNIGPRFFRFEGTRELEPGVNPIKPFSSS